MLPISKFWGMQDTQKKKEKRERPALRNQVKYEKPSRDMGGLREGIGMKTYLHGPTGFGKNAETTISCRGPGPARKKKEVYQ